MRPPLSLSRTARGARHPTWGPAWVLVASALTSACAGPVVDGDAGVGCLVGEAPVDGACAPVRGLQVNLDERQDVRDGTSRRGIGAFACTLLPFAHLPVDEEGACALYQFPGELIADGFVGDAGGLLVHLDEPITMLPSDTSCYDTDLFPTRDNLFAPHESFRVSGSGGADFPAFDAVVVAPETLAVDEPDPISRTADLAIRWLASSADALLFVVNTYDEVADESARIVCVFDDEAGEATVSSRLIGGLLASDDEAALSFLRQRVTHVEPPVDEGEPVSIDLFVTSSVIMSVPFAP